MGTSYHSTETKHYVFKIVKTIALSIIAVILLIHIIPTTYALIKDLIYTHQKSPFSFPDTVWESDSPRIKLKVPGDIESCFDEKAKCYKTHCLIDREEDVVDAVFIVYMGDNYFYIYDSQKQSGENLLLFGIYFFKHDHFKMIIYHRGSYRDPFFNQFSEIILEQNK